MKPNDEIVALWREMFGEPPPVTADFDILSRILVEHVDAAPPYRPRPHAGADIISETRNP